MKKVSKSLILFLIFGIIYYGLETLWRGYSHFSMVIVGGLCGLLIGYINEYSETIVIWKQCFIATGIVVVIEFVSGCILNLWLSLGVWDYSHMPFNLLGQVCLQFTVLWFCLSLICILLDDWLRYKLFNEKIPNYKWF